MEFKKIEYIERKTGELKLENVPGESFLKFLYYNPLGKLPLELVVKRKFLSSIYGKIMDGKSSTQKIAPFIKEHKINMGESFKKIEEFVSFNDFFIRKLKEGSRNVNSANDVVISPADGKILAFENLDDKNKFFLKGDEFTLKDFFNDEKLASKYEGGTFVIIRLAPVDYHRYHFPVSGIVKKGIKIDGDYLSVSPYAIRKNFRVYCENKREITELETKQFGDIILSEIGATMVGGIIQTFKENSKVEKGEEKGYFNFGGSSCILIFEKGKVKINKDILVNSKKGLETKVYMGEEIAKTH